MQSPGQEVVEAVLCGEGVGVEEKTGLPDLSGQDVCRSRRGGGGLRCGQRNRLGSRRFGLGEFRDVGWEVIVDGFALYSASRRKLESYPQVYILKTSRFGSSHLARLLGESSLLGVQGQASCEEGGCDWSHSPLSSSQHAIEQSIAPGRPGFSYRRSNIPASTSAGMTSWGVWG